jgi:hypothetical protein
MSKLIHIDEEVLASLSSIDPSPSRAILKLLAKSGIKWAWWAAYRLSTEECWQREYTWHRREGRGDYPEDQGHPKRCDACASFANHRILRNLL